MTDPARPARPAAWPRLLSGLLDAVHRGLLLLGPDDALLHANPRAQALLRPAGRLRIEAGRLRPRAPADARALRALLRAVRRDGRRRRVELGPPGAADRLGLEVAALHAPPAALGAPGDVAAPGGVLLIVAIDFSSQGRGTPI